MTDFSLTFLAGRTFEHALRDALAPRYGVVRTGDLPTVHRGPAIELDGERNVLTDMQIFGHRYGWLEVKAKTQANHFRKWDRFEHGIDTDKWMNYARLQAASRMPVYFIVFELDTRNILMRDLDTLRSGGTPRYGRSYGKNIINVDRSVFAAVGYFSLDVDDLRTLSVTINWDNFESFFSQQQLIAA